MLGKGALIYVLGFGIVLATVGRTLNQYALDSVDNVVSYFDQSQSHTLALMGANVGMAKVWGDSTWVGTWTSPAGGIQVNGRTIGTVKVTRELISSAPAIVHRLRSVSSFCPWYAVSASDTLRDTIEVMTRIASGSFGGTPFSTFAWMTDQEGNVFWMSRDSVFGRVHSNGNLHMDGNPFFYGRVTTSGNIDPPPGRTSNGHTNRATFMRGYETGIGEIPIPTTAASDIYNNVICSRYGGPTFQAQARTGDAYIVLNPGTAGDNDGKMIVYSNAAHTVRVDSMNLGSRENIYAVNGNVYIEGTLDGRLTIAASGSSKDIHIVNDVKYVQSPFVNTNPENPVDGYHGNDALGLVSANNIIVDDNTANSNGVTIMGALLAANGSFTAQDYSTLNNGGHQVGDILLVGSIVQKTRGAVATFNNGRGTSTGYSKAYYYDTRFNDPTAAPPAYPTFGGTYSVTDWWESYPMPKSYW